MKQFMNSRESLVTEAIDGLLRTSGGKLARLDGYPHIRVVVRTDWDRSKVALVSGGGSGHEPSHAGFVGQGMLTAAVCGDVFASPSVDAVLVFGFTAAVLGGIGNLKGAVLGGILIGIIQQISDNRIEAVWTPAIVFGYLILILIFRPQGLLGEKGREAG